MYYKPADLNSDGWPDIVTLNQSAWLPGQPEGNIIRIYRGSESGFLLKRFQDIGIRNAVALASGDFDSDGAVDTAVLTSDNKIHILRAQNPKETTVDFEITVISVPGEGFKCINAADADGDGWLDLLVGTNKKAVHIVKGDSGLTWGEITTVEGVDASHIAVGDVDGDNYQDLVISYFSLVRAAGGEMTGGSSEMDIYVEILWGDRSGFLSSRMSILEAPYNISSTVVDLDGDSRMDVVCAVHQGEKVYATESPVFFGRGGRQFERSAEGIPTEGAYHVAVVPPEGDRPAGVIFCNSKGGNLREEVPLKLYWGDPGGFDPDRRLDIPFRSGYEATAADLNEDGFTDLIVIDEMHGGRTAEADPYHGANIFWGSSGGFDFENRRSILNGINAGTSNVADLDLFLAHYHAELRRELLPSYLYWGGWDGFHTRRRTALVNDSAADGFAGDFDRDGLLDLVVVNHTIDGNHNAAISKVYYNDGKRFTNPQRIEYLPSPGAHWMWNEDMGHIYTRKWEQTYISSLFHWKENVAGGKIDFKADVPAGTKLTIAVRSAASEESLTENPWRTVESGVFRLKTSDRCMQYRAVFISDNGDRYPVLDRVMVKINQ